ncbi:hypothetical protein CBOM_08119 [Ceraceosorus bombacis]|uniref:Uncharacterized protein n=1 Tax=Ceraceosorus bombacis TaxID=401625 RepID=A0A0P1B7Z2_9BASI|nr:hypothetical protein CBOM_08119 [Ceraceosorus bombacis]
MNAPALSTTPHHPPLFFTPKRSSSLDTIHIMEQKRLEIDPASMPLADDSEAPTVAYVQDIEVTTEGGDG